jgi:hypothetical protein
MDISMRSCHARIGGAGIYTLEPASRMVSMASDDDCVRIISQKTSDRIVFPEGAGDAAVYLRPDDCGGVAKELQRQRDDPRFRATQIAKGPTRAKIFAWDRRATQRLGSLCEVSDIKPNLNLMACNRHGV